MQLHCETALRAKRYTIMRFQNRENHPTTLTTSWGYSELSDHRAPRRIIWIMTKATHLWCNHCFPPDKRSMDNMKAMITVHLWEEFSLLIKNGRYYFCSLHWEVSPSIAWSWGPLQQSQWPYLPPLVWVIWRFFYYLMVHQNRSITDIVPFANLIRFMRWNEDKFFGQTVLYKRLSSLRITFIQSEWSNICPSNQP